MKIIIPTYKRLHNQITLRNLEPIKEHITLVVRPEEALEALDLHPNVVSITDPVSNFSETIEWIVKKGFPNERIWILDDDLSFYTLTKEGTRTKINNTELILDMYKRVDELSKTYAHGGLWQPVAPPNMAHWPGVENARYSTNKWYNLSLFDATELDWTSIPAAEDFHIMLQLYERDLSPYLLMEYYVIAAATNASGGCSVYRTIEYHNESMRALQRAHPNTVSLRDKIQKTGPWKGIPRLACRISMKKRPQFTLLFTIE